MDKSTYFIQQLIYTCNYSVLALHDFKILLWYWKCALWDFFHYIVCNIEALNKCTNENPLCRASIYFFYMPLYTIKYYSSVSGGLRETKAAIWVQGSIWYRGYGSVKSTVLFLKFSHIIQLDILRPSSRENHH